MNENTKKCPYCGAELAKEARFCLYCMTPLEEKTAMATLKAKMIRWPVLLAAAMLLIATGTTLFFCLRNNEPTQPEGTQESPSSGTLLEQQTTPPATNEPVTENTPATGNTSTPSQKEQQTPDTTTPAPSTTPSTNRQEGTTPTPQTAPSTGTNSEQKQPVTTPPSGDTTVEDTPVTQEPVTTPPAADTPVEDTETNNKPEANESETPPVVEEPEEDPKEEIPVQTAVYTYRAAKSGDDFSVHATFPENSIVITGVSAPAANGNYVIPQTIDGKTVVAIMGLAFSDKSICDTVKSVTVPATVKTIWNYAFGNCNNMTDIYFCGNAIYTEAQAFAAQANRTGTLTIHCSASCQDRNFRYYKNSAANYGAVYKEWNGV